MRSVRARSPILTGSLMIAALLPMGLAGQEPAPAAPRPPATPPAYERLISINPLGLLVEYYDVEFERPISDAGTLGIVGTLDPEGHIVGDGQEEYLNIDLILRFYPSGRPMDGWAFGIKMGLTRIDGGTSPGFGFDVNRSWLLGANENFYVGGGFGLKRLSSSSVDRNFLPTFRLVNVGFAF